MVGLLGTAPEIRGHGAGRRLLGRDRGRLLAVARLTSAYEGREPLQQLLRLSGRQTTGEPAAVQAVDDDRLAFRLVRWPERTA
jgi:hypothetical protein